VNKDYKKAVEYFERSAELGYSYAYNYLGIVYEYGEGVKKDYAKAFFNYSKAAELKNIYGLYNVARCYRYGIGVKKDINKVIKYYNLSGEYGYFKAYYVLSIIYKDGASGIKKDYDIAFDYLVEAAKMGDTKAPSVLASAGQDF
jgi:TPR repeat protein